MAIITTKRGTVVTVTTDGTGVNASANGKTFGIVRTAEGIESRFAIGGKKIAMPLDAESLAVVDGLFAEVAANIALRSKLDREMAERDSFICAQGE